MNDKYTPGAPLEDVGELETRRLTSGYGWGGGGPPAGGMPVAAPPMTAPGYGYGNPAVPYAPPPYEGVSYGGDGEGSYPVIGFNPGIFHSTTQNYMKCPNNAEGCEVVTSEAELGHHLQVCEFRAIPICSQLLGFQNCTEAVTSLASLIHLRDLHEAEVVEHANFKLRLVTSALTFEGATSPHKGLMWGPVIIAGALDSDIVLICTTSSHGNLCFTGYLLGGSDGDHKQYRMKLQIDSKKSRVEWTGSLLSARYNHYTDHEMNVNTYQIPLQTLKQFAKPHHNDEDDDEIPDDQVKLKVKVGFWKLCDETKPYETCFVDADGEKVALEKFVLQSKPYPYGHHHQPSSYATTTSSMPAFDNDYSSTTSYYPSDYCTNCFQSLSGVIYQCLQCAEAKYFCRRCIELANNHSEHLTLRISNTMQQPLAAVAYECASGELN